MARHKHTEREREVRERRERERFRDDRAAREQWNRARNGRTLQQQ